MGQDSPESILPPGFGEPVPPPPPPASPSSDVPRAAPSRPRPAPAPRPSDEGDQLGEDEEVVLVRLAPPIEMPLDARRSPHGVGTLDEPGRFPPDIHIFTASKQPWVVLASETPAVPEYYDRKRYWPAESLARRDAMRARAAAKAAPPR